MQVSPFPLYLTTSFFSRALQLPSTYLTVLPSEAIPSPFPHTFTALHLPSTYLTVLPSIAVLSPSPLISPPSSLISTPTLISPTTHTVRMRPVASLSGLVKGAPAAMRAWAGARARPEVEHSALARLNCLMAASWSSRKREEEGNI